MNFVAEFTFPSDMYMLCLSLKLLIIKYNIQDRVKSPRDVARALDVQSFRNKSYYFIRNLTRI